jgi:hypothetical protein
VLPFYFRSFLLGHKRKHKFRKSFVNKVALRLTRNLRGQSGKLITRQAFLEPISWFTRRKQELQGKRRFFYFLYSKNSLIRFKRGSFVTNFLKRPVFFVKKRVRRF